MGKRKAEPHDLQAVILAEIERQGLSGYRLAKDSGVSQQVLARFISGERTLTLPTASKVCKALGLGLFPVADE